MYADFHCYPGKVAYNSSVMALDGVDKLPLNPWQIPQSNLEEQRRGRQARGYSQCDLVKSTQARVKLMFASLYPIEKGYFYGNSAGLICKQIIRDYFNRIHADGEDQAMEWLIKLMKTQPGMEKVKKSELEFIQNRFVNLPLERIKYLQNGHYDYFEELKQEYKFYLSKSGEKVTTPHKLQLVPHGPYRTWEGVYQLAQNGGDVLYRLRPDNDDVIIVLTLEGIHALGVGNPEDDFLRSGGRPKDVSIGKLKSRIRQLKGEEALDDSTLKRWEHTPFYITFAGHFNNTLCGHAHSLPFVSKYVYDQHKNMDKGVLKNATYDVMNELLGLDDDLKNTGSKRILIDVKHMSAASRQNFYKTIIRPFNRKPENAISKIPVIASQVGYSGIDRLDTQIENTKNGKENDSFRVQGFKAWNINLCDEDVIEIHDSEGLIGISLDQELLGFYQKFWLPNLPLPYIERKRTKNLLARTLEQFIHIPFDYHLPNPMRIWDILCIATGFDGANNPLTGYATVLDMGKLEEDLIQILHGMKRERPKWFNNQSPENLARKICFENAYDFVVTHYR
ncbi:MAG: hypothetical protein KF860_01710 [Cyclobacteriaceae bacterium]|nr:hypothetical protein [Cyclobacteriaceae bacterium]